MARRSRPLRMAGTVAVGFVLAVAVQARPANPAARLPQRYRLADLIQAEQRRTDGLRRDVAGMRTAVRELREATEDRTGVADVDRALADSRVTAGVVGVEGPGLRITLDDSKLEDAPSGNVNDLVIHSQDVQAVVNALWRSGAEAIAINGQRLVGTSAVLCVGNTLLLNGTVHSPPYVAVAIGASRERFESDRLVRRLHEDAQAFSLRFSVERADQLQVPAFRGSIKVQYAKPAA